MAARLTAVEVLDVLDDFELSESESEGEGDSGVTAYRGTSIVDPEELQTLSEAVSTPTLGSAGGQAAPSTIASALWASSDEEEDFQGKNKHRIEKKA